MQAEATNCHLVKFFIAAVLFLHDAAFRGYSRTSDVGVFIEATRLLGGTTKEVQSYVGCMGSW